MEEPFEEAVDDGRKLHNWMDANGFAKIRYADGEWIRLDWKDIARRMADAGILNTRMNDIHTYGMTNWIRVVPRLEKRRRRRLPAYLGRQGKNALYRPPVRWPGQRSHHRGCYLFL